MTVPQCGKITGNRVLAYQTPGPWRIKDRELPLFTGRITTCSERRLRGSSRPKIRKMDGVRALFRQPPYVQLGLTKTQEILFENGQNIGEIGHFSPRTW